MNIHQSRADAQAFPLTTRADAGKDYQVCGWCCSAQHHKHQAGRCQCPKCTPEHD